MGNCWSGSQDHGGRSEAYGASDTPTGPSFCPGIDGPLGADPRVVDKLVIEMLSLISTYVDNADRSPLTLEQLQIIADREGGWIQLLRSIVVLVPLSESFAMSTIAILLDDCPIPTKETVTKLSSLFGLSGRKAKQPGLDLKMARNICVVLGCIAGKLAGPNSVAMLTEDCLDYLLTLVIHSRESCLVLYALLALEKFAATTENKLRIMDRMAKEEEHPLLRLEVHTNSTSLGWRQVGFCAQWALDNIFVLEGRELSYLRVDMSDTHAMLNTEDASEYLKISSDGLEARCDSNSFESVRCTYQVDDGCWYYECQLATPGVMQIGWATKNSHFLNHSLRMAGGLGKPREGFGIGDDHYSSAYDGCRRLLWHEAKPTPVGSLPRWRTGDILGCLLDVGRREVLYSLNGERLQSQKQLFVSAKRGFFAAASFMAYQQCSFNFGREPFRFPPRDRSFRAFNNHGRLTPEQKQVIPRRLQLEKLRKTATPEDSCTLCCDQAACCRLLPCKHRGFCSVCTSQLTECPLCRAPIRNVQLEDPAGPSGAPGVPGPSGAPGVPGPSGVQGPSGVPTA